MKAELTMAGKAGWLGLVGMAAISAAAVRCCRMAALSRSTVRKVWRICSMVRPVVQCRCRRFGDSLR